MATENSTETPTGNTGIQITIDEKVLDELDELHTRVTNAGILMFCAEVLSKQGYTEGDVCVDCVKDVLTASCENFTQIFDAIGWTSEDRRKRQTELDLNGGAS